MRTSAATTRMNPNRYSAGKPPCQRYLAIMLQSLALAFSSLPALNFAGETEFDLSSYGQLIVTSKELEKKARRLETELDREISAFVVKHKALNALLINNSQNRALNKDGQLNGMEALGHAVNPQEVIVISEARVPAPIIELYNSIKKLPDSAPTVRLLYTESADRSDGSLLGYTIESLEQEYTKLVKYDKKTPWLEWITSSFEKDDAEAAIATKKPAPAPDPDRHPSSKSKSNK